MAFISLEERRADEKGKGRDKPPTAVSTAILRPIRPPSLVRRFPLFSFKALVRQDVGGRGD
jgi:hypothetical protein